jgi:hypothetical protein
MIRKEFRIFWNSHMLPETQSKFFIKGAGEIKCEYKQLPMSAGMSDYSVFSHCSSSSSRTFAQMFSITNVIILREQLAINPKGKNTSYI